MKKMVLSLVLMISLSGVAAAADSYSYIGLFNDTDATICYGDLELYTSKTVYVIAWLEPEISAITAAEFRLDNLPETGPLGVLTESWNTPLVISDNFWNIALGFQVPLPGPLAYLGDLEFFCIDPEWIGANYAIYVVPPTRGTLSVVDEEFETIPVLGGYYTFNCSNPQDCDCLEVVPVEPMNWSSVKSLY